MPRHALAILLALLFLAPAAADEQRAAREEVGKPVQAAQALIRQKKDKEALAKLAEADKVPGKSPYETYIIAETRVAAQLGLGDERGAIVSIDAVLATGILPPADAAQRIRTLAALEFQLKDYPATIAAAKRYYAAGGADPQPRLLMAQAAYLAGDYAAASATLRAAITLEERAGRKPAEDLLLTLASSEYKRADEAGYRAVLERLVALYPKPDYWSTLLAATARRPGFSPRLALDLARLALATGTIKTPDRYVEAAERALAAGLPGDARNFLAKGYAAGVLGSGAEAARQKRLADMAAKQSSEDRPALPQLAKEADAAPTGLAWEKLGEADASYGLFDDAIAAYRKALKKGGLANPADAQLHLGLALLAANHHDEARTALRAVTAQDGAADLARLWLIQAGL